MLGFRILGAGMAVGRHGLTENRHGPVRPEAEAGPGPWTLRLARPRGADMASGQICRRVFQPSGTWPTAGGVAAILPAFSSRWPAGFSSLKHARPAPPSIPVAAGPHVRGLIPCV